MNILIRVDSKTSIGIGHFMRCLTLAKAMRESRCTVAFAAQSLLPENQALLEADGFLFFKINLDLEEQNESPTPEKLFAPSDQRKDAEYCIALAAKINANRILVDHYALDKHWEQTLLDHGYPVLALDDLANREHACDVLVDYTLDRKESAYLGLVPDQCRLLCGASYTIIKPSILNESIHGERESLHRARTIGILMGGTDPKNLTGQVLETVAKLTKKEKLNIVVFLGPGNKNRQDLIHTIEQRKIGNVSIASDPENYAELLNSLDIAISACGSSAIELIYLKVPCILIPITQNQLASAEAFESNDLARVVRLDENKVVVGLQSAFLSLAHRLNHKNHQTKLSSPLFDGLGQQRILEGIGISFETKNEDPEKFSLRPVTEADLRMLLSWRNHPQIRQKMYDQAVITWDQHLHWHQKVTADPSQIALIFTASGKPTGYVFFDLNQPSLSQCAKWGFYLAPESEKGMGQMLGKTALSYAFSKLELDHLFGEVISTNLKSQRFHQQLGFIFKRDSQKKMKDMIYSIKEYVLSNPEKKQYQQLQGAIHA